MSDAPEEVTAGNPGDKISAAKRPATKGDSPPARREHSSSHSDKPKPSASHAQAIIAGYGRTLPFDYHIGGPYKVANRELRAVTRTELDPFFTRMYNYMFSNYYSTTVIPINPIIALDDFIIVCQFFLNGRIHFVHSNFTGQRNQGFTRLPKETRVPKPLVDVIMQYGRTTVLSDLVEVIPSPWTPEVDNAQTIAAVTTHARLNNFAIFVNMCESRNLIDVDTFPHSAEGTRAYISSARQAGNPANIANIETDEIRVRSSFPELNSSDAMYAALMVNGFLHQNNFPTLVAEVGPVSSVIHTRVEFMRRRGSPH